MKKAAFEQSSGRSGRGSAVPRSGASLGSVNCALVVLNGEKAEKALDGLWHRPRALGGPVCVF